MTGTSAAEFARDGAVGVLGGTFDPVHHGHLRLALEVREALGLAEVRLMPTALTNLRNAASASAAARLAMLEMALCPGLRVDDREIRRGGRSYTIETLTELRRELGQRPLCFILGADAWNGLPRWHRWQELTTYAHLVVATRPGVVLQEIPELARAARGSAEELLAAPAGGVLQVRIPLLPISSTDLKARLRDARAIDHLAPQAVVQFIAENRLYQD